MRCLFIITNYNAWFVAGNGSVSLHLLIPQYGYFYYYYYYYYEVAIIGMIKVYNRSDNNFNKELYPLK